VTPPSRTGRALQLLAGLVIAALLVWWAFRRVDFVAVWQTIRGAHPLPLVAAVVLATVPFGLRVPRWRLLLGRQHDATVPTSSLWHAVAIGFTANNLLPFRAGELLRAVAVNRLAAVPFGTGLSSIAIERVLDAITAMALFGVGLVAARFPGTVEIGGRPTATIAFRFGIVALVALAAAPWLARYRGAVVGALRRLLPDRPFREHFLGFVARVLDGLGALRDPAHAAPVLVWSVVIWLVNAAAFYVAFFAFGFRLPFAAALIVQGVLLVGIAIPTLPAYVGVFEAAVAGALYLFGIDHDRALAYALAYHLTTFVPITALGVWSALRTGVGLRPPPAAAT
jgi:glycosyltransferase 2 family protein